MNGLNVTKFSLDLIFANSFSGEYHPEDGYCFLQSFSSSTTYNLFYQICHSLTDTQIFAVDNELTFLAVIDSMTHIIILSCAVPSLLFTVTLSSTENKSSL